jgi:diamine N-acetyltransferase
MFETPGSVQLTIHADDTLVGYIAYAPIAESADYQIHYLLVDRRYQGSGFGKSALTQAIDRICSEEGCARIHIAYMSFNRGIGDLYASVGFVETNDELNSDNEPGDRFAVLDCACGGRVRPHQ